MANSEGMLIFLIVPTLILTLTTTHTHIRYWSQIDDALRSAAYSRGVSVRVMGSYWEHTSSDMLKFLQSLADMSSTGSFRGTIETVSLSVCQSACLSVHHSQNYVVCIVASCSPAGVCCAPARQQDHPLHSSQSQ